MCIRDEYIDRYTGWLLSNGLLAWFHWPSYLITKWQNWCRMEIVEVAYTFMVFYVFHFRWKHFAVSGSPSNILIHGMLTSPPPLSFTPLLPHYTRASSVSLWQRPNHLLSSTRRCVRRGKGVGVYLLMCVVGKRFKLRPIVLTNWEIQSTVPRLILLMYHIFSWLLTLL